jgi:hypothetical protein
VQSTDLVAIEAMLLWHRSLLAAPSRSTKRPLCTLRVCCQRRAKRAMEGIWVVVVVLAVAAYRLTQYLR